MALTVSESNFDSTSSAPKAFASSSIQQAFAALVQSSSHALLLEGPPTSGQQQTAFALAHAWLCETPDAHHQACGCCASCHLLKANTHPDLRVLAPETWMLDAPWPLPDKARDEIAEKKRKPSKEIRIDAMLSAVEFSQRTRSRAMGQVVIIYPAEAMNTVTANALLKTLEEPPEGLRFILASEAAYQLLPTIRSRCMVYRMPWKDPIILAEDEHTIPARLFRNDIYAFKGKTPRKALVLCLCLCHDLWLQATGIAPRFYTPQDLPPSPSHNLLARWHRLLLDMLKSADHPYREDLLLENLATQSARILRTQGRQTA